MSSHFEAAPSHFRESSLTCKLPKSVSGCCAKDVDATAVEKCADEKWEAVSR